MSGGVRVASDVGGTFTDSIAYDPASERFTVSKVPTTPADRAEGTVHGLAAALAALGAHGTAVDYVGHGMTTATNAVIQRQGARVAFVTNEGIRDLLEIGRQNRPRLYDHRVVRTPPLAERAHTYTVRGRLDERGAELTALDEAGLRAVARSIAAAGVDAVAVCFLHAYASDRHEVRARAILEAELPGVVVCTSTELVREFREYERASTTVLNAYLVPVMARYLGSLERMLRDTHGPVAVPASTPIMVMEASGGLMTLASARSKPVHTVLSGPAGGVVSAAEIARRAGFADIVTMDMGGTSTDVSLIVGGQPQVTNRAELEGMPVRVPVVDIIAIGAGGGSIAAIDEGGALRVGPRSAEAEPGPACYGRGGTLATVTDANVVLGRLGETTALGGSLRLDVEAARNAIGSHIAEPLGLDLMSAAAGIVQVANASMERAIRVVSVERGHDPREFALVPFGGAGPLHAAAVAEALGIPHVLVPPAPGILCAMGMLMSDLRHDLVRTHRATLDTLDTAALAGLCAELRAEAEALLAADGVATTAREVALRADLRYVGQSYEIGVPLRLGDAAAPGSAPGAGVAPDAGAAGTATDDAGADLDRQALADAFHAAHLRQFGHADERAAVELVNLRVRATGRRPPFVLPALTAAGREPEALACVGRRPVWFAQEQAFVDTPVLWREGLRAGNVFDGPAVVEELSATTLVRPGDRVGVDASGNLLITLGKGTWT